VYVHLRDAHLVSFLDGKGQQKVPEPPAPIRRPDPQANMATVEPDAIIEMVPQVRDPNQFIAVYQPESGGRYKSDRQIPASCEVVEPPEECSEVTMLEIEWKRVAFLVAQFANVRSIAWFVLRPGEYELVCHRITPRRSPAAAPRQSGAALRAMINVLCIVLSALNDVW
jgi:hypothetical protein